MGPQSSINTPGATQSSTNSSVTASSAPTSAAPAAAPPQESSSEKEQALTSSLLAIPKAAPSVGSPSVGSPDGSPRRSSAKTFPKVAPSYLQFRSANNDAHRKLSQKESESG